MEEKRRITVVGYDDTVSLDRLMQILEFYYNDGEYLCLDETIDEVTDDQLTEFGIDIDAAEFEIIEKAKLQVRDGKIIRI